LRSDCGSVGKALALTADVRLTDGIIEFGISDGKTISKGIDVGGAIEGLDEG